MMNYESFLELCEHRRSIRYFDTEPVSRGDLEKLLVLANLAPNVQNTQPWRFHVIVNEELKQKVMTASCYGNFIAGASAFVVVTADQTARKDTREIVWNPRELEYSCVSAIEHMALGAAALGLGSCWISLHHGQAHEILKLPTKELVVGGLMIGKLKRGEEHPSGTHQRKPLEDVVTWHE